MRILITGISGFLGWNLAYHLAANRPDWQILGTYRTNEVPLEIPAKPLDLEDPESIRGILEWSRPDVIVHAAAMSKANDCETDPEKAHRINAEAVRHFVRNLEPKHTHFILCSTDCVFNGLNAPYDEDATPTPPHAYGRTKAAGEQEVLQYSGPTTIVRFALMFGDGPAANPSFLGWLDAGLRTEKGVTMFSDEIRTALYAQDAAKGLTAIIEKQATGIYHLGGPEAMARDEFALLYAQVFGLDTSRVHSAALSGAQHPIYRAPNLSLNIQKARQNLNFNPVSTIQALTQIRLGSAA